MASRLFPAVSWIGHSTGYVGHGCVLTQGLRTLEIQIPNVHALSSIRRALKCLYCMLQLFRPFAVLPRRCEHDGLAAKSYSQVSAESYPCTHSPLTCTCRMQIFSNSDQVRPSSTCGDGDAHSGTEGNPIFRDAGGVIRTTGHAPHFCIRARVAAQPRTTSSM